MYTPKSNHLALQVRVDSGTLPYEKILLEFKMNTKRVTNKNIKNLVTNTVLLQILDTYHWNVCTLYRAETFKELRTEA